ncbi:glycosyltransferase [Flagellimonas pacifica]|uniref:Glycosyltransferase involved in cell wall bisynthesis n=1 Tax=Flagellimonas pacifica TaxID=1247520 RepID=A0A285MRS2_9FLAO|nr:glycosyltransferase [Allomuricauda parva]SNY99889.1 Glycosyltransferase involved in cell wall bisynthesis [Allomuricauda parva]
MDKTLLIIGYVWPEPSTTAAGHRMLQLIHTFKSFGYHITFGTTAAKSEFSFDLNSIGVEYATIQLNHPSFDAFVQDLNPDIVVFDRFMMEEQFGWRVAEFAPSALRILNTEDLHSLRKTREESHKKGEGFSLSAWKNHPMTLREAASIYRSDLTLMISSYEMEILQKELEISGDLLVYLPFMLDQLTSKETAAWPSFEERKDFISYGNGKHAPNIDSIKCLKESIWPLIREKLPNANLKIYGAYLPEQIQQLHNPKRGFYVLGWVGNLNEEIQKARVCLAPLWFGAGIKGKLIDAMKNGTPSVTTSIGAEGMYGHLPWNGTVVNDWVSFAEAAVELYENQEKWEEARINGATIVNQLYNKGQLQNALVKKIKEVQENLETHRNRNFMGKMLQQQTTASTKYMAKWIEEKNRS